ncbi:MAG: hypothetical protein ABUL60_36245 [Myxococcales bacterium]
MGLVALLVVTSACGDGAAPTPTAGATGGQSGASGSSSGAGAAGAPAAGMAGSTTSAGTSALPAAGAAGQAGTGGAAGQSGGGAGGAGMGGAAGTAGNNGGNAGGGTSPTDDSAALAPLNGYQLLDPCDLTNYKVEAGAGAVCPQLNAVKNQHVMRKLAGDANVTYDVTLRVRGIVERYWYEGGTLDPVSKVFYTGGVPTVGGFASACKNKASELPFQLPAEVSPSDGCFNGFNVFAMMVSSPKQHFYLNYTTDKDNDRPPHAVYSQDYTVTIKMQGQATLDFYIIGSDEHQCYNHDKVIDGVTLTSSPYIGEFLQFDVLKVARAP